MLLTRLRHALRPLIGLLCATSLAACGGTASTGASGAARSGRSRVSKATGRRAAAQRAAAAAARRRAAARARARALARAAPADHYPPALGARWTAISRVSGRPALWIAQRSGVTLVRIDQSLAHLVLHAGSEDPGGTGWRYGDAAAGREIHGLILGFNGGFKFNVGAGGFLSYGRTGVTLTPGDGSVVTYRSGRTDIGAWQQGVPQAGQAIASVRQNLHLLIDRGVVAPTAASCGQTCWGATVGGVAATARSGLGVRSDGELLWAAGEGLTVSGLADAMAAAGAVRAVELDINPDWVAGYLYIHHRHGPLTPVPVVPGQYGIYGHLLSPYSRDFFTVDAH